MESVTDDAGRWRSRGQRWETRKGEHVCRTIDSPLYL